MEETEVKAKAKELLKSYLNKRMRVAISDGRVIDGNFLCTDRDSNIVLGNCEEFSSQEDLAMIESRRGKGGTSGLTRTLGLAIVPGKHIRSIAIAKDHVSAPKDPPTQLRPPPVDPPTQPHPLTDDSPTQPCPPPEDLPTQPHPDDPPTQPHPLSEDPPIQSPSDPPCPS